jgi:nuclear pore complex protein Nup107
MSKSWMWHTHLPTRDERPATNLHIAKMPPVTRRAQSGGIAKKPATRKQRAPVTRNTSSSWDWVDPNDAEVEPEPGDDVRESVEINDAASDQSASDVEEAVRPLREMADRVGREVENFAIEFDKFLGTLPRRHDRYDAAKDIVRLFRMIAEEAVDGLKKTAEKESREQLRREWADGAKLSALDGTRAAQSSFGGVVRSMKAEKVKELRQWQQEADIWQLFYLVLNFWYNRDARREENQTLLRESAVPHRYTPEKTLWQRFLLENEIAREYSMYKEWLESTADHQESDLNGIVQELEARSGAGSGLWAKGWLHTREAIKGEKRKRTWPSPGDSVQPQLRSASGTDILITTLDPDAPTRQDRALEPQDKYFEQAIWIACWEMMRRGKPWDEVKEWCEERSEGWRAAILAPTAEGDDSLCNAAWRKMCYLASESGCSSDYEAAVYGLLGGNVKAVQKVCRTVDDHLFAHYSCTLVRQFDLYLQKCYPARVPSFAGRHQGRAEDVLDSEEKAQQIISSFIVQLRSGATTSDEAVQPMKLLESYLLANEVESLTQSVGTACSDLDQLNPGSASAINLVRPPQPSMLAEAAVALDKQTLRIVAHMYLVLTSIDKEPQPEEYIDAEENVLIAYIQALRAAGKRDHTVLYASRLREGRAVIAMARVFEDISNAREQQEMLGLMKEYELDSVEVLDELLARLLATTLRPQDNADKPLTILEDCEAGRLYPGRRIIDGFLDEGMDEEDVKILRTLQWFQLLPGHWALTFRALAKVLVGCLRECLLPHH